MNKLRFIAFDFDGTLMDSADAIVVGVKACWAACGFPEPEDDQVRRIIGLPWEESVEALIPGAGAKEVAQIKEYHADIAAGKRTRHMVPETLFPGAAEMLSTLDSEDYLLGIVTSRGSSRLYDMLEEHRIHHHFVTIKTVDHGPGKPNPYLLREAMKEAGVDAADTIMVGDTVFDIQMACNAGTASIGVSWGVHEPDELTDAGAHHVADEFHDIPPVIGSLIGKPPAAGSSKKS